MRPLLYWIATGVLSATFLAALLVTLFVGLAVNDARMAVRDEPDYIQSLLDTHLHNDTELFFALPANLTVGLGPVVEVIAEAKAQTDVVSSLIPSGFFDYEHRVAQGLLYTVCTGFGLGFVALCVWVLQAYCRGKHVITGAVLLIPYLLLWLIVFPPVAEIVHDGCDVLLPDATELVHDCLSNHPLNLSKVLPVLPPLPAFPVTDDPDALHLYADIRDAFFLYNSSTCGAKVAHAKDKVCDMPVLMWAAFGLGIACMLGSLMLCVTRMPEARKPAYKRLPKSPVVRPEE